MPTKEEILKKIEEVLNAMKNPKSTNNNKIYLGYGLTQEDYEAYYGKQPNIEFIKPQKLSIKENNNGS